MMQRGAAVVVGWTLVVCLILWTALASSVSLTRIGDRLQIVLPVAAAVCSAGRGALGETVGRFIGSQVVVHGLKHGLGDAPINLRPSGRTGGFPSGHTSAAVFGASVLIRDCSGLVPYLGPLVALAAAFVGGSRIEARKHGLMQVMAGGLIALVFDLSFRTEASRAWLGAKWRRIRSRVITRAGRVGSDVRRARIRFLALVAARTGHPTDSTHPGAIATNAGATPENVPPDPEIGLNAKP